MFSNFLVTGLTPLCATNELQNWENRPFTATWPAEIKLETTGIPDANVSRVIRRKQKRFRTSFTTEQLKLLENTYSRCKYLTADRRKQLAETIKIGEKHIKVWFQNRRMKEKRESSESSCDSSVENSHQLSPSIAETTELTTSIKSDLINQDNPSHYQLPTYHVPPYSHQYCNQYDSQINQYQNIEISDMPPLDPAVNNAYPTYYYPNNEMYSQPYHNFSYQPENTGFEYWCPDNVDLSNFNCNQ